MQLAFAFERAHLIYALKVFDDGNEGGILWSILESEEELDGIRSFARGGQLVAYLFNELAVNVAWHRLPMMGMADRLSEWADSTTISPDEQLSTDRTIRPLLERLHQCSKSDAAWSILEIGGELDWKQLQSLFVTAGGPSSLIDIFDRDEGSQQEHLGIWLTDNLQPSGVHHAPLVTKGNQSRELTDLLLSHEFGAVLLESKTLSILTRERLPDRTKLKRDVAAHVEKAFVQLRGALRALKGGLPIMSQMGGTLLVEREKPAHAIVLIPELALIDDRAAYNVNFMRDFTAATGSFGHLLDISELLRVVQAAEMIASRSSITTKMMAFDYYLMERAAVARKAETLCIEVLLRFSDIE